jgi:hypothetical protein
MNSAFSGHKYVSSLAVYQRVSDQEKLAMGNAAASHISSASSGTLPLPAPEMRLALPAPEVRPALPAPEIRPTLTVQDIRPARPNQESGPVLPGSEISPVIDVTEGEYTCIQLIFYSPLANWRAGISHPVFVVMNMY